jgi:hypothetical protein
MVKSYEGGKPTLRGEAVLLNLTLSEAIDLFSEMGCRGNISAKDVMESLKGLS